MCCHIGDTAFQVLSEECVVQTPVPHSHEDMVESEELVGTPGAEAAGRVFIGRIFA